MSVKSRIAVMYVGQIVEIAPAGELFAQPFAIESCKTTPPAWEEIEPGRFVRCHHARELTLSGVSDPVPPE